MHCFLSFCDTFCIYYSAIAVFWLLFDELVVPSLTILKCRPPWWDGKFVVTL